MKCKKSLRLLSAVMAMIMLFGFMTSVTTSAVKVIAVTLRVEGLSGTLESDKHVASAGMSLKAVLTSYLDVTYSSDTGEITTVEGESALSSSSWQYAVDGEIKTAKIEDFIINDDCEVVLFNGTANCVYPTVHADEVSLTGVVQFTGKSASGSELPIAGATVSWGTQKGSSAYTTDKNGKIYITEDDLTEGTHSVQITSKTATVPNVVRLASDTTIKVEKQSGGETENKTILQKAYDFVYTILAGIYEGFMFYVKTIIGWFD